MPKFCPECGAKLEAGDEFCTGCGLKLGKEAKELKEEKKTVESKKEEIGKPFNWVRLVVILALVFFGLIVLFFIIGLILAGVYMAKPAPYEMPPEYIVEENANNMVILFYWDGCPYCAKAKEYLNELELKMGDQLSVKEIDVRESKENSELANDYSRRFTGNDLQGVPLIIVNEEYYLAGWGENSGKQLESYLRN